MDRLERDNFWDYEILRLGPPSGFLGVPDHFLDDDEESERLRRAWLRYTYKTPDNSPCWYNDVLENIEKSFTELDRDKLAAAHGLLRELNDLADFTERQIAVVYLAGRRVYPDYRSRHDIGIFFDCYQVQKVRDLEARCGPDWADLIRPGLESSGLSPMRLDDIANDLAKARSKTGETIRQTRILLGRLSRPGARRLTLLSLPEELLRQIFEYFFKLMTPHDLSPIKTVKSCRLTCRRLYHTGASFLIPGVRVTPELSSLTRLEAIANHPIFSRSVRTVRFELSMYKRSIATDLERYIHCCKGLLDWGLGDNGEYKRQLMWHQRRDPPAYDNVCGLNRVFGPITSSWMDLSGRCFNEDWSAEPEEKDKAYWDFIKAQHAEYRRLYKQQRHLVKNERFFERVAAAVAKMPFALEMQFNDLDIKNGPKKRLPFYDIEERPLEALAESGFLLQPEPLVYGINFDDDAYFGPYLARMLCALGNAGRFPNAVSIFLPATDQNRYDDDGYFPAAIGEALHGLVPDVQPALSQMESFCLAAEESLNGQWIYQRGHLEDFLEPFFNAPRLEQVVMHHVDMTNHWTKTIRPYEAVGRILSYKPRPNLKRISLMGVQLTDQQLRSLFCKTNQPFEIIELASVQLIAGTWTEILDLLRAVDCPYKFIKEPRDAEIGFMDFEQRSQVFHFHHGYGIYCSRAHAYINGVDMLNPLLEVDLEELVLETVRQNSSDYYEAIAEDEAEFLAADVENVEGQEEEEEKNEEEVEVDDSNSDSDNDGDSGSESDGEWY